MASTKREFSSSSFLGISLRGISQDAGLTFMIRTAGEVCTALISVAVFWAIFSKILGGAQGTPVDPDTCSCSCWDGKFKNGAS